MAPTRPFPVNAALTAIAIGYTNPAVTLIADQVLPYAPVLAENFSWTEFPLEEGFTVPNTLVGRKGRPNQIEFSGTARAASTEDHALDDVVPLGDIAEAQRQRALGLSNYDPRNHAVEMLANVMNLGREVRVADMVQNPDNFASGRKVALSGTDRFSDYDNSDPIGVIKAMLEGTLVFRPNVIVMGQSVWSKLSSHPHIVMAIRGTAATRGIVTRDEFARLFEVQKVLVGESYVNTARKGQAAALSRVWGKTIAALYIDPTANTQGGITFGYTARLGTKVAGSWETREIGMEGSEVIRVGNKTKELIVAKDVGYLITNAVA